MKISKERITCACFTLENYTFREDLPVRAAIPIPITSYVMDHYNEIMKEAPRIRHFLETDVSFITSHGRIVNAVLARRIAIEGDQIDGEGHKLTEPLSPLELWPK